MGNFKKIGAEVLAIITMIFISVQAYALSDVSGTWSVNFNQVTNTTMTLQHTGVRNNEFSGCITI